MNPGPPIWRLSFGSFRHLGLSSSGRALRQRGRVSGEGRLAPIWYVLVVNTVTGRLDLDFALQAPDEEFLCAFWRRVVVSGPAALGPMTTRLVVARGATTGMDDLIDAITSAGTRVYHGRMAFKAGVHAGRSFEDMLATWFLRHSLFGLIKNWRSLWPRVVQAYNEFVLLSDAERYKVIGLAERVTSALGECPKEAARKAHAEGALSVTDSRFVRGPMLYGRFVNRFGDASIHSGYYWRFMFFGDQRDVPLYVPSSRSALVALRLHEVFVPSASVPAQFRNSYHPSRPDPNAAVPLSMAAEQLAKRAWGVAEYLQWIDGLAGVLRGIVSPQASRPLPQRHCAPDAMLSPELAMLGFSSGDGHWTVASGDRFTFGLPVLWQEPVLNPLPGPEYERKVAGVLYVRWSPGKEPRTDFSPEYCSHDHMEKGLAATVGAAVKAHPRAIIKEGVLTELEKQHPRLLGEWFSQKRSDEEKAARKRARAEVTAIACEYARNLQPPGRGYDQFVAKAYKRALVQAYLPILAPRGRCDIPVRPGFVYRCPYDRATPSILGVLVAGGRAGIDIRLTGIDYYEQPRTIGAESLDPATLYAVLTSAAQGPWRAGRARP